MNGKRYIYYGLVIKVPEGYEWVATDKDGAIWCYPERPVMGNWGWWLRFSRKPFYVYMAKYPASTSRKDWKDSLRHVSDLEEVTKEETP